MTNIFHNIVFSLHNNICCKSGIIRVSEFLRKEILLTAAGEYELETWRIIDLRLSIKCVKNLSEFLDFGCTREYQKLKHGR